MMTHRLLLERRPRVHPSAFIAPTAVVFGDVEIGEEASIWFQCVLRGDVNTIRVGRRSNIQDQSVLHGVIERYEVVIGDEVTVGHCGLVHGCVVEDRCLVGMGSRILSGAVVGAESIVAAGAVVKEGQRIPPRSLVAGVPAAVKRALTDADVTLIREYCSNYLEYRTIYKALEGDLPRMLAR